MKQLGLGKKLKEDEIKIIKIGEKSTRQKYEMMEVEGHHFKRLNKEDVDRFQLKDSKIKMVYQCVHSSQSKCRCKLVVFDDNTAELLNAHTFDLAHLNDVFVSRRIIARKLISEKVNEMPTIKNYAVYAYLISSPFFLIDCFCPSKRYIVQRISHEKRKIYGSLPNDIDSIDFNFIEKQYPNFLRFDLKFNYKKNETKRCIGFATDFQMKLMKENMDCLFLGDGTFSSSPTCFNQLYIIHLLIDSKAFPVMYVLTETRTTECYYEIFNWLKSQGIVISSFMSDFEKSTRKALKLVYSDIELHSCNFHFVQSLMKHVRELKLDKIYSNDILINKIIRKYFSLPFVELKEVVEFHKIIQDEIQSVEDEEVKAKLILFDEYFKKNWLEGEAYRPADWNQCKDIKRCCNNWSESFHSSFSQRFYKSHPNIYHLLYLLDENNKILEYEYNDLLQNPGKYINKVYNENRAMLRQIMDKRNTMYKNKRSEFLDALSNLQFLLCLKIEMDLLVANKLKPERVKKIQEMISGEREISIFDESSLELVENEKKIRKLKCITRYHCKKINEIKRKEIENLKKEKRILEKEEEKNKRLKKIEYVLTTADIEILRKDLNDIDTIPPEQILKERKIQDLEEEIREIIDEDEDYKIETPEEFNEEENNIEIISEIVRISEAENNEIIKITDEIKEKNNEEKYVMKNKKESQKEMEEWSDASEDDVSEQDEKRKSVNKGRGKTNNKKESQKEKEEWSDASEDDVSDQDEERKSVNKGKGKVRNKKESQKEKEEWCSEKERDKRKKTSKTLMVKKKSLIEKREKEEKKPKNPKKRNKTFIQKMKLFSMSVQSNKQKDNR